MRRREIRRQVSEFIESPNYATRLAEKNLKRLGNDEPELVRRVRKCTQTRPCGQLICTACTRLFRLDYSAEVISIALSSREACDVVSIDIRRVGSSDLSVVDIRKEKDALRKRLLRSGITKALGGLEVSYDGADDAWKLHIHLLVIGASASSLRMLAETSRRSGMPRAFMRQDLGDPVRQLTYLLKFATGYRPSFGTSNRKPSMRPLPRPTLRVLSRWWADHRCEDFTFLLGFRRREKRIERSDACIAR